MRLSKCDSLLRFGELRARLLPIKHARSRSVGMRGARMQNASTRDCIVLARIGSYFFYLLHRPYGQNALQAQKRHNLIPLQCGVVLELQSMSPVCENADIGPFRATCKAYFSAFFDVAHRPSQCPDVVKHSTISFKMSTRDTNGKSNFSACSWQSVC